MWAPTWCQEDVSPTQTVEIFTPWAWNESRPPPWAQPSAQPWDCQEWQPELWAGPPAPRSRQALIREDEAIDKLVDIVEGLTQDLREERAENLALAERVYRKRCALEYGERPTKNRVLSIEPTSTPQTATPDGSFHGSEEETDRSERGMAAKGRSQGFSSVLSTESSPHPKNALGNSLGRKERRSRGSVQLKHIP